MKSFSQNTLSVRPGATVMYVDMNSFFASCEQQEDARLRGQPVAVCTHESPYACVIAPSVEAKTYGIKTGMRLNECRMLCPQVIPVVANPVLYRKYHVAILNILRGYCEEVIPKSIDEAVMDLTSYRLVYKDVMALAMQVKADILKAFGAYIRCSVGIAPNAFLAKLATDLQKPDGLVRITPENLDGILAGLSLTDLPGIAKKNEARLRMMGIRTPLEMRYVSSALLRKAFGGIIGYYWHCRLNFMEVDLYQNDYRGMSAMRTVSPGQRTPQGLDSLLISLCTRLEQRLVKQGVFCREAGFFIRYRDQTGWDTRIRFERPVQDGMDIRNYILHEIRRYEQTHAPGMLLHDQAHSMGVSIHRFVSDKLVQYSLFDNDIHRDHLRKVLYQIKDKYGKNSVRKASETIMPDVMRDAIGFGSVKDMYQGAQFNQYLLEE